MNLQDAGIGISRGDNGLIIGSAAFGLLSGTMIVFLSKRKNQE
jgi:hypothetical protein